MKKIFLIALIFPFLMACQNDDNDFNNSSTAMATVENPTQKTDFYLNLDNGGRLKVSSSAIQYYRPKDGQRVIADFSVIAVTPESSIYSHVVRLNDVYEVLTKNIFYVSPATQDSIGNDKIQIQDIWIGGNFLNVEFVYPGYNRTHYINLVSDDSKQYTDGKIHLEFRHNANNDYPDYNKWGIVSFNLASLRNPNDYKVDLVIHTNEFYSGNRTYNISYIYGSSPVLFNQKIINMPVEKSDLK